MASRLLFLALLALTLGAQAADFLWLPGGETPTEAEARYLLHYRSETGQVLSPLPGVVVDPGATRLSLVQDEELFAVLLSDADAAEFQFPARVLIRNGHEVLVASSEGTPRLTEAAAELQHGLVQPVHISSAALPWRREIGTPPPASREHDPIIQAMVDALTTEAYMATWQSLEDFVTRYTHAPQNELAAQWMLEQFQSFGLDAEFHTYQQSGTRKNVVATLPGLVDPSRVVYITAHFDATSPTPETCAPGADDNGSGTAAVLEAARILSQYPFEYTIKFVCFNGEEQGLYGSAAYVSDIYSAGEDVIGCYNIDMIAYRGTDPAPPDLILYTDSASAFLAYAVRDACDDYLPGLIEPVVLVEALSASDHASFWNYGYAAICAIEEEAWGSDFCPWYHTCEDLIWRYPEDYVLNCAKANLAALAATALPLNPSGPYLVMSAKVLDDDDLPPSDGDGDGIANPGESIEIWVTLRNVGSESALDLSGILVSDSGDASVLVAEADWANLPQDAEASNLTPFLVEVSGSVADGGSLPFTLNLSSAGGLQDLGIQLSVSAPNLAYHFHRLNDASSGNGNGILDPGEVVKLAVSLSNLGSKDAQDVNVNLSSFAPEITVLDASASAIFVASGSSEELAPAFTVQISSQIADGVVLPLLLNIGTAAGYQGLSEFVIKEGTLYYDECESDTPWNLSSVGDDAGTGVWVRVDPNGTEYDGEPCQPEDDHTAEPGSDCFITGQSAPGASAGSADVDGGRTTLTSPAFDLSLVTEARVSYWRWYTNNLGNNPGEDEWLVQVSNDGGANWTDLERTTASNNAWTLMSFLVEDFIAPTDNMVFRFVASDENNASLVEAGVDDFEISGLGGPVTAAGDWQPTAMRLAPPSPNPSYGATDFAFALPASGPATLKIYSVDGRHVRTLLDDRADAGAHLLSWDGRDDSGRAMAPGVYFSRLEQNRLVLSRKLVLLK